MAAAEGAEPRRRVAITTPASPAWTGNSLHVVAVATASSGAALASLKLYGNGGAVLTTTCAGTTCTLDDWWNTSPLPNASYEIQAVATTTAGTQTISPVVVVNKNATSPVVPSGAGGRRRRRRRR